MKKIGSILKTVKFFRNLTNDGFHWNETEFKTKIRNVIGNRTRFPTVEYEFGGRTDKWMNASPVIPVALLVMIG